MKAAKRRGVVFWQLLSVTLINLSTSFTATSEKEF
jgi:hypothetical protein